MSNLVNPSNKSKHDSFEEIAAQGMRDSVRLSTVDRTIAEMAGEISALRLALAQAIAAAKLNRMTVEDQAHAIHQLEAERGLLRESFKGQTWAIAATHAQRFANFFTWSDEVAPTPKQGVQIRSCQQLLLTHDLSNVAAALGVILGADYVTKCRTCGSWDCLLEAHERIDLDGVR